MEVVKKCCKCGDEKFYIMQKVGAYKVKCTNCSTIIAEVALEKYETLLNICRQCESDKFKAKILKEGNSEKWILECASCNTHPEFIYVDEDLHDIDVNMWEMLILNDFIDEININIKKILST